MDDRRVVDGMLYKCKTGIAVVGVCPTVWTMEARSVAPVLALGPQRRRGTRCMVRVQVQRRERSRRWTAAALVSSLPERISTPLGPRGHAGAHRGASGYATRRLSREQPSGVPGRATTRYTTPRQPWPAVVASPDRGSCQRLHVIIRVEWFRIRGSAVALTGRPRAGGQGLEQPRPPRAPVRRRGVVAPHRTRRQPATGDVADRPVAAAGTRCPARTGVLNVVERYFRAPSSTAPWPPGMTRPPHPAEA